MSPPLGAIRVATMFRMVLLLQPEVPSRATNSPSLMRNEASSTATTSRPSARKSWRSPSISMRDLGGVFCMRRLEELVGDGILELQGLLDPGELADPDLLAAGVGFRRDQAIPVGDVLQLADLE